MKRKQSKKHMRRRCASTRRTTRRNAARRRRNPKFVWTKDLSKARLFRTRKEASEVMDLVPDTRRPKRARGHVVWLGTWKRHYVINHRNGGWLAK